MNNNRSNGIYYIWILGGVYLIYLAIKLGRSLFEEPMGILSYFFPILFAVAGAVFIIMGIRHMKKERQLPDMPEKGDIEDNTDEEEGTGV